MIRYKQAFLFICIGLVSSGILGGIPYEGRYPVIRDHPVIFVMGLWFGVCYYDIFRCIATSSLAKTSMRIGIYGLISGILWIIFELVFDVRFYAAVTFNPKADSGTLVGGLVAFVLNGIIFVVGIAIASILGCARRCRVPSNKQEGP